SYAAARNRFGLLVETHSWKTYAQRVVATHDTLQALFERALVDLGEWNAAAARADEATVKLGGSDVPLSYATDANTAHEIDFPGYAYVIKDSEISGKPWVTYDESKPQMWRVPLFDRLRPEVVARAPRAGYFVPAAHAAWIGPLLRAHGVSFEVLSHPV